MKKRKIANAVMVAVICLIVAGAVLGVGALRGWFDRPEEASASLSEVRGLLTLERNGASFTPEAGSTLRTGDTLTTDRGARATVTFAGGTLHLSEKTALRVASAQPFRAEVTEGEAYATGSLDLTVSGERITLENATVLVNVRTGSASCAVLAGQALDAKGGEMIQWVGENSSVLPLEISSLNTFAIACIRKTETDLCFTQAEIDALEESRKSKPDHPLTTAPAGTTAPTESTDATAAPSETTKTTLSPETNSDPAATETTVPSTTAPTMAPTTEPTTEPISAALHCVLTIRCDTILSNMENLDPGKAEFVPDDGWILYAEMEFTDGETVFDVLKRACANYGIQIEYSWTPMYNSYYVEGINNLYEFDCGEQSGWMYAVNGWYPNYGCSAYTLADGDIIGWAYTCNGYGADLGAPMG